MPRYERLLPDWELPVDMRRRYRTNTESEYRCLSFEALITCRPAAELTFTMERRLRLCEQKTG